MVLGKRCSGRMTFQWSELLIVVLGGLVLFLGLALLILRRRNEVLQEFLTPEQPDLEAEFFRVHEKPQEDPTEEEIAEPEATEEIPVEQEVQWGTQT